MRQVPVLILAQNTDACYRLVAALRAALGADYSEGTHRVIELLHYPRSPQRFVSWLIVVEPVQDGEKGLNVWRATVTTVEGSRGRDYRCVDPQGGDHGACC